MKLKSFGCSFTYGSDLSDCLPQFDVEGYSKKTWPALLAQSQGLEYECHAYPGIGNLQIMNSVLTQAELCDPAKFIINWTWIDRFDYLDPMNETFLTLRPDGDSPQHQLYYRYFYNQYHTMLTNSAYISSTIAILKSYDIPFLMTIMDKTIIDSVDPGWQDPRPIQVLQKTITPYLNWFEDQTFLDWSYKKGYPISDTLHPLDSAHQAAFELIKNHCFF
jgi:hypothetical protein